MSTRREFLQGASALATLAALPTTSLPALGSAASSSGKAQVNLNSLNPESYGLNFPFIDCGKMMTPWQLVGSDIAADMFSYLNADGFPTGLPAGGTNWRCQSKCYLTSGPSQAWTFDWDGNIDL